MMKSCITIIHAKWSHSLPHSWRLSRQRRWLNFSWVVTAFPFPPLSFASGGSESQESLSRAGSHRSCHCSLINLCCCCQQSESSLKIWRSNHGYHAGRLCLRTSLLMESNNVVKSLKTWVWKWGLAWWQHVLQMSPEKPRGVSYIG